MISDHALSKVYFHVGLERTATTFLQRSVFPKFKGIHYIPKRQYFRFLKACSAKNPVDTYLVSKEFNLNFDCEMDRFKSIVNAEVYPIIALRTHSAWLVSQYKRYLKNGVPLTFREFFDWDTKEGFFEKESLNFYHKLVCLEKTFKRPPYIIFYDAFKKQPAQTIQNLAKFMDADLNIDQVDLTPRHASYSIRQLQVLLWYMKKMPVPILKKSIWVRYPLLYLAKWIPGRWEERVVWYAVEDLIAIDNVYRGDWEKCVDYAKQHQV